MDESVSAFQEYLTLEGKAPKTIESYISDLKNFLTFLEQHNIKSLNKLTRKEVLGFREQLLERNYRPATINKAVNSLHSYTNWLIDTGRLPGGKPLVRPAQDRIKIAPGSGSNVEVLSDKETEQLLSYVSSSKSSQRDRLIVNLLLFTGVRAGELINIRLSDMDLLAGELKVIGKGERYREIPLKQELVVLIRDYISGERRQSRFASSPYLLLSQRAGKLNRDTINTSLENIGKKLNLKLYPHLLRHTFCTSLLRRGADLTTVAELAGHADVQTTVRFYINTSKEDKERALRLL